MRTRLVLVALTALLLLPLHVLAAVEGRVWIDANGNGQFDSDESPAVGCLVSDGQTLVRTDPQGRYRIQPAADPSTVFVINPSGTWPSGKWWSTGGGNSSDRTADFPLKTQKQDGPLVFAHGTDIHLKPEAVELYRKYVAQLNALPLPVQFVVHTGDLVIDSLMLEPTPAEKLFTLYEEETKAIRFPLREVIGNHEHVGLGLHKDQKPVGDYGKGMFQRRLGPTTYAFRYGPYHFIALDGSTVTPEGKNGYIDRLDDASAAWAGQYLQCVGADEPVVLLIHQPLGEQTSARQLLQALEGKRLLVVLCGHGHGRGVGRWGDAPSIMGGAVSYAWHGIQPYPPDPWGYVVYRLDGNELEYAFLDWAAERSVDLKSPAWKSTVSAKSLVVEGTVNDFDGSVRQVACRLGDVRAEAKLTRTGHLTDRFEASLDCAALPDGVYELVVETTDASRTSTHARPVMVFRGQAQPFTSAQLAKLLLRVTGAAKEGCEVRLNDQVLAKIPASKGAQDFALDLPAERLQRLNKVTVTLAGNAAMEVSQARIQLGDRSYRDVRFSPLAKRTPTKAGESKTAIDYYIDLKYSGSRATP